MTDAWEQLASLEGGRVAGLAITASKDGTLVFAATPAGVYQSTDAGPAWAAPAGGHAVPFADSITLSPRFAQDQTLFVCAADGLYRSTNASRHGSRCWSAAVF